jgi:polysaccharide export outer membrane protein
MRFLPPTSNLKQHMLGLRYEVFASNLKPPTLRDVSWSRRENLQTYIEGERMKKETHPPIIAILAVVVGIALFGCATQPAVVPYTVLEESATEPSPYLIQPGDQLEIKFFYNSELNETVVVRPDGKISLQLVDEIQAAGIAPAMLDEILTQKYASELKRPVLTVIVRSFTGQRVYVGGEVNRPGLVSLTANMSALQAVINAGGLRETAKLENAIVIRKGKNRKPIPMRVDLSRAIYEGDAQNHFRLKPYDIVYVPKTFIAKANKFVNQYIEQLILFKGVSFGFSYEVHDAGVAD